MLQFRERIPLSANEVDSKSTSIYKIIFIIINVLEGHATSRWVVENRILRTNIAR
jgi:hypothetical protein